MESTLERVEEITAANQEKMTNDVSPIPQHIFELLLQQLAARQAVFGNRDS